MKKALCILALLGPPTLLAHGPRVGDSRIGISWQKSSEGWQPERMELRDGGQTFIWGIPDGSYTVLYTPEAPSKERRQMSTCSSPCSAAASALLRPCNAP